MISHSYVDFKSCWSYPACDKASVTKFCTCPNIYIYAIAIFVTIWKIMRRSVELKWYHFTNWLNICRCISSSMKHASSKRDLLMEWTYVWSGPRACLSGNTMRWLLIIRQYKMLIVKKIQPEAVITRSNITWYWIQDCSGWGNIKIRVWNYKTHPKPRPDGRAMGFPLWKLWRKLVVYNQLFFLFLPISWRRLF